MVSRFLVGRYADNDCIGAEAMKAKVLDPDDKVRAAVCKAYGELDFETAAYHASEETLRQIAGRCLDRKVDSTLILK